jgi:hypothetical protein
MQVFATIDTTLNQFTIMPGTYKITVNAPSCGVGNNQVRIKNITTGEYIYGANSHSLPNTINQTVSYAYFTNRHVNNTYQIEHICQTTAADVGYGFATSFAPTEIYTVVYVYQIQGL